MDPPSPLPDARAILAATSTATALVASDGRILHANDRFWSDHGNGGGTGQRLQDLVEEADDVVRRLLTRWASSGSPLPGTLRFRRAPDDPIQRVDGARVPGEKLLLLTFQSRRSSVRPFSAVAADVERANLQAIQWRLEGALRQLDHANSLLQLANEELGDYASMVSHDLRNPLLTISAFAADLASRYPDADDDLATAIGAIGRNARRALDLIDAVLRLARLQIVGPTETPHDVGPAIAAALEQLGSSIRAADATVEVSPELPRARVEPAHLELLLQNLIGNAVRFRSPERPCRVELFGEQDATTATVVVQDNGIGIPADRIEDIFAPFERGSPAVGEPGTGIGLTTCRKIVQRYGGELDVRSAEGVGTTVTLRLPA